MKAIIGILLIMACIRSYGRLGESHTQCDQRYNVGGEGESKKFLDNLDRLIAGVNTTNVTYRHDGWLIRIGYLNGYAAVIQYARLDNKPIDQEQAHLLVRINCPGESWVKSGPFTWTGSRGTVLKRQTHRVTIESHAYGRHREEERRQKERALAAPGQRL